MNCILEDSGFFFFLQREYLGALDFVDAGRLKFYLYLREWYVCILVVLLGNCVARALNASFLDQDHCI